MKQIFLSLVFSLFLLHVNMAVALAGSVSGQVTDQAGKAVVFASVLLLKASDSSNIKTEVTNEKGEYVLTPVPDGAYMLKVVMLNFETYLSAGFSVVGNELAMPLITLLPVSKTLNEVAVRAQKPFIEVRADKLVVNVENSIVSTGGSVLDVLSHSPGVNVDQNDNISMKGKQGVNVMINGKIQPIKGTDLANMLKSMPSNAVDQIELIANPSAKYDAAGTAGIINIKLKKDSKLGLNGTLNGTYAQGIYGKGSCGFNMNYRDKRVNLFAGFNQSKRAGFNHLMLNRRFYSGATFAGAYVQDNYFADRYTTSVGNLGADYTLSKKTVLGVVVNGDIFTTATKGTNHADIIDSASQAPVSRFHTSSNAPSRYTSYAANVNLRHKFDSIGKTLAVDMDYAGYNNGGPQDFVTTYTTLDGTATGSPVVLHGERTGLTRISSFKADYTHPLTGGAKMEAGAKLSYVVADNNPRFYNVISGNYIPDASKTNHFIYHENINAGYLNLSKDWPKWSTQLGLRAEQTMANGDNLTSDTSFDRNYVNLFPSMALQRHVNVNNDLGITVSRRIERPSYQQLNPFKYYLDPTTYTEGYPYLKPALSYSFELSHVFKQRLITTLSYVRTAMPLTEVIQPSETEQKITVQTVKNLTSMSWYGASGSYQFRFSKWWNNTTNLNAYYSSYVGDIAGTYLNKGKATFDVNTTNSFVLPKSFSAELSFNYQAPQVYGYMYLLPTWMLNVGVQKNLFDKKATIRVNATDIFWHGYPRATSYYSNYVESFVAVRDTRQVAMSFTYRFGKRTLPQSMRHRGGAEEEKRRAGTQGS